MEILVNYLSDEIIHLYSNSILNEPIAKNMPCLINAELNKNKRFLCQTQFTVSIHILSARNQGYAVFVKPHPCYNGYYYTLCSRPPALRLGSVS